MNTSPPPDSRFWPHYDNVLRTMRQLCRNSAAEDHVQSAYINLSRNEAYRENSNFRALFRKAAVNHCRSTCGRMPVVLESVLGTDIDSLAKEPEWNALKALCQVEEDATFSTAMSLLQSEHPRWHECLTCYYLNDLSGLEVSELVNVSIRTVRNDVEYALRFLRQHLVTE